MKKIVFLQDDYPPEHVGGAAVVASVLAQELCSRGYEVDVITTTRNVTTVGSSTVAGVRVHRIYSNYHERWRAWLSLNNRRVVREVTKLLKVLQPDIVHVHNIHYHLSYASLRAAKNICDKVFLTAHDTMLVSHGKAMKQFSVMGELRRFRLRYNPFRNFFIRRALRSVTVLAVSKALQNFLQSHGIESRVLYNGVNPMLYKLPQSEIEAFRNKYNLKDKKVVLFAGRISKLKGADAVKAMFERLRMLEPAAVLLIAGTVGEASGCVYTGWLSAGTMRVAYVASDVVVYPSLYLDPFGLINIEAMASGKPVVASTSGGASEVVEDGVTGFVVDPNDSEVFAARVAQLLKDHTLAHKMGEAGRVRVENNFSLQLQADTLTKLYEA